MVAPQSLPRWPSSPTAASVASCRARLRLHMQWRRKAAAPGRVAPQCRGNNGWRPIPRASSFSSPSSRPAAASCAQAASAAPSAPPPHRRRPQCTSSSTVQPQGRRLLLVGMAFRSSIVMSDVKYWMHKDDEPLPSPLPVPLCDCGIPAEVKQSRCEETAGQAFYKCCRKSEVTNWYRITPCNFFKWIDGPDKFDPRIRLFPWRSEATQPFEKFRRWVPPPPNPLAMTNEEKADASERRIMNPPYCHCSVRSRLIRPNPGVEFTLFFRCPLRDSTGGQICDFQEYIYVPKSHWPTEVEIEEFNSGRKKWPYMLYLPLHCKCGILARKGVVPSELGYGWYCGNSYDDFWEGRGCDWEYFSGRKEWLDKVNKKTEAAKVFKIEKRKNKIRLEYGVLVPKKQDLDKLQMDMFRDLGKPPGGIFFTQSQKLVYWRRHRARYPPGVPEGQEDKEEKEKWRMKIQRRVREVDSSS